MCFCSFIYCDIKDEHKQNNTKRLKESCSFSLVECEVYVLSNKRLL